MSKLKIHIKYLLKYISVIRLYLYKMVFPQLKFKCRGVALMKLRLIGSAFIDVKSGYIVKSDFFIKGQNNVLIFNDNVKISNCKFVIHGDNCILDFRGSRVMFKSRFELLDSNTKLTVGNNTGFNRTRIIVAGKENGISIGSDCIFAENVEIWSSDTHSIVDADSGRRINPDKSVIVGDRVWFGTRVMVQKGVTIGNDVIIASGSIVTKDVPNNTLVAGIPAQPIKSNVKWDINRL